MQHLYCAQCGGEMRLHQAVCHQCGWTVPKSELLSSDAAMRMVFPVGTSLWAIASGYLGLISVLVIPAPFALITGIAAIIEIKSHPGRRGMARAIFGIVMGGLISAVALMAVLGVRLGIIR